MAYERRNAPYSLASQHGFHHPAGAVNNSRDNKFWKPRRVESLRRSTALPCLSTSGFVSLYRGTLRKTARGRVAMGADGEHALRWLDIVGRV